MSVSVHVAVTPHTSGGQSRISGIFLYHSLTKLQASRLGKARRPGNSWDQCLGFSVQGFQTQLTVPNFYEVPGIRTQGPMLSHPALCEDPKM